MSNKFTYKFVKPSDKPPFTKAIRYTNGQFAGWTEPTGIARVPYAIFRTKRTELLVPEYDLTPETLTRIGSPSRRKRENQ